MSSIGKRKLSLSAIVFPLLLATRPTAMRSQSCCSDHAVVSDRQSAPCGEQKGPFSLCLGVSAVAVRLPIVLRRDATQLLPHSVAGSHRLWRERSFFSHFQILIQLRKAGSSENDTIHRLLGQ